MYSVIFYWIFNMSVAASITGLLIYFIGKIPFIPKNVICLLYLIPFLRMIIPVGINSKYSLMSLISKFTSKTVTVYEGTFDLSLSNYVMGAQTYFPFTYKTDLLRNIFGISFIVWLIIASALLVSLWTIYITTMIELKDSSHLRSNIYVSDKVTAPAVYGILKPKILLPTKYDLSDLDFILMHENAHIRRKDNLWRVVAISVACVHWFNPLTWLFLKNFLTSLELACDEAVLKQCNDDEKHLYAKTLLNCLESKSIYLSAFGGAKTRVRIQRILSYKSLSVLATLCLFILALAIGYVLLTNAK
ncbi:MAG: M56 family metallopeptidase [Clostridia bacterium]|nr:M56 family metallopeptidase [Clostridia bacterium]